MQSANPGERIVLVGDFNAFEFNDGYVDVLGVVKGTPAPDAEVLTAVPSPLATPLIDGSQFVPDPRERYSYVFEGNAQSLDHVLLNQALIADAMHVEVDHPRINADFGVDNFGDASTPVRVSDHDPVRVRVSLASFRSADLQTAMNAPASVLPGHTAHFDVQVANAGPNDASNASVAFVLDGAWSPNVAAPAGWACDAPLVDATTTTVICRNGDFAPSGPVAFGVDVAVPVSMVSGAMHLAASAASSITDPANADNGASATVAIDGRADLKATVSGPVLGAKPNVVAHYPARIINIGPAGAWQPVLHASGDVAPGAVVVNAPVGWTCAKSAAPVGFQVTCTLDGAMASGGIWTVDLAITSPQRPANDLLDLSVDVSSASPDPAPANNAATSSTRVR